MNHADIADVRLHVQPIVQIVDGKPQIIAAEALARHPRMNPYQLFAAADAAGLSVELARHIRDEAAKVAASLPPGIKLYVNIRVQDLLDAEFFGPASALAMQAALGRIMIEVTERERLDSVKDVVERVARLRTMGYGIVVDDLGAGHSNFMAIALLLPQVVKIDMSIVRNVHLPESRVLRAIIASVMTFARLMDVQVICEGVENKHEAEALVVLGCDKQQGYYHYMPRAVFPLAA